MIVGLGGLGLGAGGLGAAEGASAPVIPSLHHKHPLSEGQIGAALISKLRCASCHEGMSRTDMKTAPDLADVGSRVTPEYLQRFIADPAATHPGTTMPDLLATETAEKRQEISALISHYLGSLQAAETEVKKMTKEE